MSDVKAWATVVGLGLIKIPAKIVAPFVVPFLSMKQRVMNPVFGVRDASPEQRTWWNIGIRNGCHNMVTREQVDFETWANTQDHTLECESGLQWRYRRSLDHKYVSFRVTWAEPRRNKGKREWYVGWTMNDQPYMRLTFFQLRLW